MKWFVIDHLYHSGSESVENTEIERSLEQKRSPHEEEPDESFLVQWRHKSARDTQFIQLLRLLNLNAQVYSA